ncbi:MAG: hypothetical protein IKB79_04985 [Oscillospiraceae bacterium]|nr:hypothetical protein [Oscillospiraceae bacterium]
MNLLMTKRTGGTWSVTQIVTTTTWSGDKSAICRQLICGLAYLDGVTVPMAELGDLLALQEGGDTVFEGVVLRRELASEDHVLQVTAFDKGYYLQRNDGTYKFNGATPEAITRRVCENKGIPIAALPTTGVKLQRKFAAVALNQIVTTAWSLAREQTGKEYAIRYTPAGLLVKERSMGVDNPVIAAGCNLMDAKTVEDATRMVNSVAIYDSNGNFLRRMGDESAQQIYGLMEGHITQAKGKSAQANDKAKKALQDGVLQRTVTVNVLGDVNYVSGETVVAREASTGLTGVFWIDGDVHTWKNDAHYTRLTLNCRNVMATANAGSDLNG